jgi:hypothetical protein
MIMVMAPHRKHQTQPARPRRADSETDTVAEAEPEASEQASA